MHKPRAAFAHPDFCYYTAARFLSICSYHMLVVALSQYVYEQTRHPFHLGLMGFVLFLPKFGLALIAGHAADRYDRRRIILIYRGSQCLIIAGILFFYLSNISFLWGLYPLLILLGSANAFEGPASHAIVADLVPEKDFNNAVAWNSSTMQMALIMGPALSGSIYVLSHSPMEVLVVILVMRILSFLLVFPIKPQKAHAPTEDITKKNLFSGLQYVFKTRLILGTISLDLFAVLLGGATALMPIFANDILHVGPSGLGYLRAAPSLGAAIMALWMAYRSPLKNPGLTMLWCVALFGISTLLFGFSQNFYFSLFILFVLGAADMVSVVVRGVLVQIKTPPAMRGRVSAVNLVFIGASNELGEFESGVLASLIGTVPAVVAGGIGTLVIVAIWARIFPEIREYKN